MADRENRGAIEVVRDIVVTATVMVLPISAAAAPDYDEIAQLVEAGKNDEAAWILRRSLSGLRGEDLMRARYELGLTDTDPINALSELKGVATLSPVRRAEALLGAGELLLSSGDPNSAFTYFDEAATLRKGEASERAAYFRGVSLFAANRCTEAREAFSDYLVGYLEGAYQPSARIGVAVANERLGRRREAIEIYKAILAQHRGFEDEDWILGRLVDLLSSDNSADVVRYRELLARDFADRDAVADIQEILKPLPEESSPPSQSVRRASTDAGARPATQPSAPQPGAPQRTSAPATPASRPAPQPTRPAQAPAASASVGRYRLQIGAFRDAQNIERVKSTFAAQGYPVESEQRNGLTVLLAGRYATREAAERALPAAERLAGNKMTIVEKP